MPPSMYIVQYLLFINGERQTFNSKLKCDLNNDIHCPKYNKIIFILVLILLIHPPFWIIHKVHQNEDHFSKQIEDELSIMTIRVSYIKAMSQS
jgi:hypothetical protein